MRNRRFWTAGAMLVLSLLSSYALAESGSAILVTFDGDASFTRDGQSVPLDWDFPCTQNDRLQTGPGGQVDLAINRECGIRAFSSSDITLLNLNPSNVRISFQKGSALIVVKSISSGGVYSIDTPAALLQIKTPSQFYLRIWKNDAGTDITTAAVRKGNITAAPKKVSVTLGMQQDQAADIPNNGQIPSLRSLNDAEWRILTQASSVFVVEEESDEPEN